MEPAPSPRPTGDADTERGWPAPGRARPLDYWLLWLVALASLGLNLMLINSLLGVRQQVGQAASTAAQGLSQVQAATITYTVHINQALPVALDVPLRQTLRVPIDTILPVNTRIQVPLDLPVLGTRILDVPIQANLPIKFEVQIPLNLTIPVSANVPLNLEVPIAVAVADTPLSSPLAGAQKYLTDLAAQLQSSLLFGPGPTATAAP